MMIFLKVAGAFLLAMLPGTVIIIGAMYLYRRRAKKISEGATALVKGLD